MQEPAGTLLYGKLRLKLPKEFLTKVEITTGVFDSPYQDPRHLRMNCHQQQVQIPTITKLVYRGAQWHPACAARMLITPKWV